MPLAYSISLTPTPFVYFIPGGGGGGGVLKEFLGGDVPLGPWNP